MHIELMRDNSRDLPAVSDPAAVVTARIWHCKYRTMAGLSHLTNLEGVALATYPDESFEALALLRKLRYVSVVHLPNITDLGPLANLHSLETLSLHTLPSWDASSKWTHVRSLSPLTELPQLRHLELLGVVPDDGSLTALAAVATLETARFHGYRKAEVAAFFDHSRAANAHAPEPWF